MMQVTSDQWLSWLSLYLSLIHILAQGLEQGLAEAKAQQAPIHARMQQLVSEFQTTLDALDSVIDVYKRQVLR